MTLEQVDLRLAESSFAVANTPMFLIRKLRADPAVQELGSSHRSEEILRAIEAAVGTKPRTLLDAVRPYVYLVALSFDRDVSYLVRASQIRAPYFDWYEYIAQVLREAHKTTSFQSLATRSVLVQPQVSARSTASVTRLMIPAGQ